MQARRPRRKRSCITPGASIALESFTFPEPVISVALKPAADADQNKLRQSIARLCSEDPTLVAGLDAETQEELLSGMGELHLEVAVDRLKTEYGVEARASVPRVAYRETVRRRAVATGMYWQQTGGHGHFAVVRLRVEPHCLANHRAAHGRRQDRQTIKQADPRSARGALYRVGLLDAVYMVLNHSG